MKRHLNIMIVSSVWPHVTANEQAANVISYELVRSLTESEGFSVKFLYLSSSQSKPNKGARADIEYLKSLGVSFLDPVIVAPTSRYAKTLASKLACVLSGRPERLLTGGDAVAKLESCLEAEGLDAVMTVWSETASNVVAQAPLRPWFSYAGNPDHKVLDARLALNEAAGIVSLFGQVRNWGRRAVSKMAHLNVAKEIDLMWNVAAIDAEYYRGEGVNAKYMQNMWPIEDAVDWSGIRDASEQNSPLKIVGSVGNIGATGNSFGLITLCKELIPELEDSLGKGNFEIHIFGGGEAHPAVRPFLNNPHIHMRGFVEDLDREILSSPIFLVANNSSRFKVGHTRFLHAWSRGSAVVGFTDSREAMPEIVHGENAYLGSTAAEVARHVAALASNREERRRIGANGLVTLRKLFAPSRIGRLVADDIRTKLGISAGEGNAIDRSSQSCG